jgi:hypothetical protein
VQCPPSELGYTEYTRQSNPLLHVIAIVSVNSTSSIQQNETEWMPSTHDTINLLRDLHLSNADAAKETPAMITLFKLKMHPAETQATSGGKDASKTGDPGSMVSARSRGEDKEINHLNRHVVERKFPVMDALAILIECLPQRNRDDMLLQNVIIENVAQTELQVHHLHMHCVSYLGASTTKSQALPLYATPFPLTLKPHDRASLVYFHSLMMPSEPGEGKAKPLASASSLHPLDPFLIHASITLTYTIGGQAQLMSSIWDCKLLNPLPLYRDCNHISNAFLGENLEEIGHHFYAGLDPGSSASPQRNGFAPTDLKSPGRRKFFIPQRISPSKPKIEIDPNASKKSHDGASAHEVSSFDKGLLSYLQKVSPIEKSTQEVHRKDPALPALGKSVESLVWPQSSEGSLVVTLSILKGQELNRSLNPRTRNPMIAVGDYFFLEIQIVNRTLETKTLTIRIPCGQGLRSIAPVSIMGAAPEGSEPPQLFSDHEFEQVIGASATFDSKLLCLDNNIHLRYAEDMVIF